MLKVSVIIPFYNEEKYIFECIVSVMNQTLKEIEILLIDDGSIDQSITIVQALAEQDSRIKFVKQKNQGLGPARNHGLSIAKGEYVAFVDADDFIAPVMLEEMYQKALGENLDIVQSRFQRVDENGFPNGEESKLIDAVTKDDFFRGILGIKYVSIVCDKLFKRTLFEAVGEGFPSMLYEDLAFAYKLFYHAERIGSINEIFYNWRKRDGSITQSFSSIQIENIFLALQITYDYLNKNRILEIYEEEFFKRYIIYITQSLERTIEHSKSNLVDVVFDLMDQQQLYSFERLSKMGEKYPNIVKWYFKLLIKTRQLNRIDKDFLEYWTQSSHQDFFVYLHEKLKFENFDEQKLVEEFKCITVFNHFYRDIQKLRIQNKRLALYGFGTVGQAAYRFLDKQIVAIIDKNLQQLKAELPNKDMAHSLDTENFDIVLITVIGREQEIMQDLQSQGINLEKLFLFS